MKTEIGPSVAKALITALHDVKFPTQTMVETFTTEFEDNMKIYRGEGWTNEGAFFESLCDLEQRLKNKCGQNIGTFIDRQSESSINEGTQTIKDQLKKIDPLFTEFVHFFKKDEFSFFFSEDGKFCIINLTNKPYMLLTIQGDELLVNVVKLKSWTMVPEEIIEWLKEAFQVCVGQSFELDTEDNFVFLNPEKH